MIEGLSAITLATHDMRRAVRFYQALGFEILYGGEAAAFTSFRAGTSTPEPPSSSRASLSCRIGLQRRAPAYQSGSRMLLVRFTSGLRVCGSVRLAVGDRACASNRISAATTC